MVDVHDLIRKNFLGNPYSEILRCLVQIEWINDKVVQNQIKWLPKLFVEVVRFLK